MTNIQAIDLLKGLEQSLDDYCELNDEGKTAFHMAITALEVFGNSEQLPSAQPESCEDAVSRKQALEYYISLWEIIGTIMDRDEWEDVCKTTANELSPVQPARKPGTFLHPVSYEWIYSECGCVFEREPHYKFCPNCGADMRSGGTNE